MENYSITYENLLLKEIKATPEEYLPALLNIIRLFRESVTLKPAEMSFKKGWEEAMSGDTLPLEDLWEGIDAD
ncbi:MAG: hypothetical protein V2I97_18570 [Desulfococcaceae bacterium]|jgi:hypothetical protein|nr:hypothetical protein [Desulfococcaceae bacterium]